MILRCYKIMEIIKKINKTYKIILDVEPMVNFYLYMYLQERIKARRERIQTRIQAAKRLTKLMKIQKLMGFKVK